jgi:hypothetical protein
VTIVRNRHKKGASLARRLFFFRSPTAQGATTVSITESFAFSDRSALSRAALRKNTVAAAGTGEMSPDAMVAPLRITLENPPLRSVDHWTLELPFTDPIESVQDCVALTLTGRPSEGPATTDAPICELGTTLPI